MVEVDDGHIMPRTNCKTEVDFVVATNMVEVTAP